MKNTFNNANAGVLAVVPTVISKETTVISKEMCDPYSV